MRGRFWGFTASNLLVLVLVLVLAACVARPPSNLPTVTAPQAESPQIVLDNVEPDSNEMTLPDALAKLPPAEVITPEPKPKPAPEPKPMPKPIPKPKPVPKPLAQLQPASLVGLTDQALLREIGAADFVRFEGEMQIWQYKMASCVTDFFLYQAVDPATGYQVVDWHSRASQYEGRLNKKSCREELATRQRL